MMMGHMMVPGLFMILITGVNILAFWKLCPRAGLSPWWSLLSIIPVTAILLLWFVAFKKWPTDRSGLPQ